VLQIRGDYSDVTAATLYDVIHDPVYRSTWDPNILEGKEICRIDNCNDIGYYASKYRNLSTQRDEVMLFATLLNHLWFSKILSKLFI
jgi:hypothetical protein